MPSTARPIVLGVVLALVLAGCSGLPGASDGDAGSSPPAGSPAGGADDPGTDATTDPPTTDEPTTSEPPADDQPTTEPPADDPPAGGTPELAYRSLREFEGPALFSSVTATDDGGALYVGQRGDAGWAVRVGPDGDVVWNRTYRSPEHVELEQQGDAGPPYEDGFTFAVPDGDGGFLLAGWLHELSPDLKTAWLVHVDADGDRQWQRYYATDSLNSFESTFADGVRTADGSYLLAGVTLTDQADSERYGDGLAARIEPNGSVRWDRRFAPDGTNETGWSDDAGHDEFLGVAAAGDGSYLLAGEATPTTDDADSAGWLQAVDGSGQALWNRTYSPDDDRRAEFAGVARTDNRTALVGPTGGNRSGASGGWTVAVDGDGDEEWRQAYDAVTYDAAGAPGSLVLAGAEDGRAWVARTDRNGSVTTALRNESLTNGSAYDAVADRGDGYHLAGRLVDADGTPDAAVAAVVAGGPAGNATAAVAGPSRDSRAPPDRASVEAASSASPSRLPYSRSPGGGPTRST